MSQLLPYMMPDWLAGVDEGTPQRHRCSPMALSHEALNVGGVARSERPQQVLVRQPVNLDDDEPPSFTTVVRLWRFRGTGGTAGP